MMFKKTVILVFGLWISNICLAGPYAPAAGLPGSTAIAMPSDPNDTSVFKSWATGVTVRRGDIRIDNPSLGHVSHGEPDDALGRAQGMDITGVVSLGDAGEAVLTFDEPIANGPGPDFAVFENGFAPNPSEPNILFLELAFVEVSSDGTHYERFPAVSLTQSESQISGFGYTGKIDTTDIHNFAGKYKRGQGAPFDLAELQDVNDFVDVTEIRYVRIVDIVGTLLPEYARYDSQGNIINDPWATDFSTGGFDLDAVGVMHEKTLMADINGDGIVNLEDYTCFSASYLSTPSMTNWNYRCEMVPFINDKVDLDDMGVFFDQWLSTEDWYLE